MTIKAVVYKPTKNAMQSGKRNTKNWIVEISNPGSRYVENLMGWTASTDTTQQIKLHFQTMEDAIRYVKSNFKDFEIRLPNMSIITPKSYSENFLD